MVRLQPRNPERDIRVCAPVIEHREHHRGGRIPGISPVETTNPIESREVPALLPLPDRRRLRLLRRHQVVVRNRAHQLVLGEVGPAHVGELGLIGALEDVRIGRTALLLQPLLIDQRRHRRGKLPRPAPGVRGVHAASVEGSEPVRRRAPWRARRDHPAARPGHDHRLQVLPETLIQIARFVRDQQVHRPPDRLTDAGRDRPDGAAIRQPQQVRLVIEHASHAAAGRTGPAPPPCPSAA